MHIDDNGREKENIYNFLTTSFLTCGVKKCFQSVLHIFLDLQEKLESQLVLVSERLNKRDELDEGIRLVSIAYIPETKCP